MRVSRIMAIPCVALALTAGASANSASANGSHDITVHASKYLCGDSRYDVSAVMGTITPSRDRQDGWVSGKNSSWSKFPRQPTPA